MTKPNNPSGGRKGKPEHKVLVSGAIQIHRPPEVEQRHSTERKEDDTAHKAERKEDRGRENKKMWLEGLTLLAVIIYAGITYWQGTLTRESIDNNSKQFRVEQRPYVWYLENIPPENVHIVKGDQMFINFNWVDYGKTPAINFAGTGKIYCGPDAQQTVEKWFSLMGDGSKPFPPSLVQGPNRSFPIPPAIPADPAKAFLYSSIYGDDVLTQDQVSYILDTNNACYAGIRMQYFDSYGARYWSDICLARQKNGVLAHCDTNNEMH